MLKKRTLSLLLSLAILLTFMPAMAFAEGDEADAEPQKTELTAEEVETETAEEAAETTSAEEAVEEVPAEEAVEAAEDEEAEVTSLTFIPVSGFEITADEGESLPDFYAVGNKFIFKYSDGKTEEYVCRTYNINNSEGYIAYEYSEKNTHDVMADVYPVINGEEDGVFRIGIDNTVAFRTGNAYTDEFPVEVAPAPAALEFIPAAGVTLWAFEGAFNIDDSAFYAKGNKFIVTYSDGSKKTFVCEDEQLKRSGKTQYYTGYFEENKSHTDANGVFLDMDFYYGHDIPDSGFVIGNNTIRFHVRGADGDVFSEEYNVIGKPEACTKHKLRSIKAIKATCQEGGVKAHYECTVCHKIFTDKKGKKETTYAKLATKKAKHVFKKKIVSDEYLKSPATCTKKATYFYACKTCGEKGKKTFTAGKALGHDFVSGNITKATAKKDGKIAAKCSRCGKTDKGKKINKASKVFTLSKKSVKYMGEGKEKNAVSLSIKAGKYPVTSEDYSVTYSEPVYNGKKSKGTITITFRPECKYYSGSLTLTYKITKVPKK